MAQVIEQIRQGTLAFAGTSEFGTRQGLDLKRGNLLREIYLQMTGSFTYALAANNDLATLGRGDEWSAVQRIEVIQNGSDVIRSFSGPQLVALNRLFFGTTFNLSATLGNGVATVPTFDSTLIIPFWMPLASRPLDTALDTSKLSALRIEITLGQATDINSASGPTQVNIQFNISTYESYGVTGEFTKLRLYSLQRPVTASNPEFDVQINVNPMYRGFIIGQADGAGNSATETLDRINTVRLLSGSNKFIDLPWAVVRDTHWQRLGWNRQFTQIAANLPQVNGTLLREYKGNRTNVNSWAFLDLCKDGLLGESIDTLGFSELKLQFDVNLGGGAWNLTVIPVELTPLRKAG